MAIKTIFLCIYVIIVICLLIFIYYPQPVALYLRSINQDPPSTDVGFEEKIFECTLENFPESNRDTMSKPITVKRPGKVVSFPYYYRKGTNSDKVIIDIPGGGFMAAGGHLSVYKDWANECDVYYITYPTLFEHTIGDAIVYINLFMENILKVVNPENITIIGTSSGAYYASKVLNLLESSKSTDAKLISSAVLINGYYGWRNCDNMTMKVLDATYMDRYSFKYTRSDYDVVGISGTELMIIVSDDDQLKRCGLDFANKNSLKTINYPGSHTFFWADTETGKIARQDVLNFIMGTIPDNSDSDIEDIK
jgi:acetyl esterase/lipase